MCGIMTLPQDATLMQNNLRDAVASVPDDSFSRAVVEPVVIAETGLFTRANREAACVQAAQQGFTQAYGSLSPDAAVLAMVSELMGLSAADPRHDQALAILQDHKVEAMAAGKTETEALESVFALACMSPGAAGVGF
jgi:phosphotransferase system HPr-like phosphotransfer protein